MNNFYFLLILLIEVSYAVEFPAHETNCHDQEVLADPGGLSPKVANDLVQRSQTNVCTQAIEGLMDSYNNLGLFGSNHGTQRFCTELAFSHYRTQVDDMSGRSTVNCHSGSRNDRSVALFNEACAQYTRRANTDRNLVQRLRAQEYINLHRKFNHLSDLQYGLTQEAIALSDRDADKNSCLPSQRQDVLRCFNSGFRDMRQFLQANLCNSSDDDSVMSEDLRQACFSTGIEANLRDALRVKSEKEESLNRKIANLSAESFSRLYLAEREDAGGADINSQVESTIISRLFLEQLNLIPSDHIGSLGIINEVFQRRKSDPHRKVTLSDFSDIELPNIDGEIKRTVFREIAHFMNHYEEFNDRLNRSIGSLKLVEKLRREPDYIPNAFDFGVTNREVLMGGSYVETDSQLISIKIRTRLLRAEQSILDERANRNAPLSNKEMSLRIYNLFFMETDKSTMPTSCTKLRKDVNRFCEDLAVNNPMLTNAEAGECLESLANPRDGRFEHGISNFESFLAFHYPQMYDNRNNLIANSCHSFMDQAVSGGELYSFRSWMSGVNTQAISSGIGPKQSDEDGSNEFSRYAPGLEEALDQLNRNESPYNPTNLVLGQAQHKLGAINERPVSIRTATSDLEKASISNESNNNSSGGRGPQKGLAPVSQDYDVQQKEDMFSTFQQANNSIQSEMRESPQTQIPSQLEDTERDRLRDSIQDLSEAFRSNSEFDSSDVSADRRSQRLISLEQELLKSQRDLISLREQLQATPQKEEVLEFVERATEDDTANRTLPRPVGPTIGQSRSPAGIDDQEALIDPIGEDLASSPVIEVNSSVNLSAPGQYNNETEKGVNDSLQVSGSTPSRLASGSALVLSLVEPPNSEYDLVSLDEIQENILENIDIENITLDQLNPGVTYILIEPGVFQEIILHENGTIDQRRVIVREMVDQVPDRYRTIIRTKMFDDLL